MVKEKTNLQKNNENNTNNTNNNEIIVVKNINQNIINENNKTMKKEELNQRSIGFNFILMLFVLLIGFVFINFITNEIPKILKDKKEINSF